MLIEIHMLKNYPPSNLNRDDMGAPKSCFFGGIQRARISSQCLKRSWRTDANLAEEVGKDQLGIRTRCLPELVAEQLTAAGVSEEYVECLTKKVSSFGNKAAKENEKDPRKTVQIIFYTPSDVSAVTEAILARLQNCQSLDEVKKIAAKDLQADLKKGNKRAVTVDMALFGRMVTSDAFADIDASMQVAHAFSTSRVQLETDFFTAVDDQMSGSDDEPGSGMMGDVDFTSACFYSYASIDTDALLANLAPAEDAEAVARKVIPALLKTMVFSNPTGHQNTFAAHALPAAILIECKDKKIPVSYANAYETPVYASAKNGSVTHQSVERLSKFAEKMQASYGLKVEKRLWFTTEEGLKMDIPGTVNCNNFNEMLENLPA